MTLQRVGHNWAIFTFTFLAKDRVEVTMRWEKGCNHNKIKSHPLWVGNPQTGEQITEEVLPLLWRFWASQHASKLGDLTLEASGIWLQDFHRAGGNRDSSLGGHKQNLVHTKIQGKESVTPQETEPDLPASVRGSPVEVRVGSASRRDTGSSSPGRRLLAWVLSEVAINPAIAPWRPQGWEPQAKQLTGREPNPTHQQMIRSKLYWARSCPLSKTQFSPTSLSH